jgi:predicted Zn-dependent protease
MKKFDEAIHVLEQGIKRIPDSEILLSRLGHTYLVLGRLKRAMSIHPAPLAFYNLAVALRKAGNLKEAIHYLKLYLENAKGVDEVTIRKAREELSTWENRLRQ